MDVTSWDVSIWEMMKVGERAHTLARAFNAREGFTAKDDYLPEHFYIDFSSGPLADKPMDKKALLEAKKLFYEMAGWDPELASPTADAKLHELDLSWAVEELDKTATKK